LFVCLLVSLFVCLLFLIITWTAGTAESKRAAAFARTRAMSHPNPQTGDFLDQRTTDINGPTVRTVTRREEPNHVLLVKIEGPVWYTIYHHLLVVKG